MPSPLSIARRQCLTAIASGAAALATRATAAASDWQALQAVLDEFMRERLRGVHGPGDVRQSGAVALPERLFAAIDQGAGA